MCVCVCLSSVLPEGVDVCGLGEWQVKAGNGSQSAVQLRGQVTQPARRDAEAVAAGAGGRGLRILIW